MWPFHRMDHQASFWCVPGELAKYIFCISHHLNRIQFKSKLSGTRDEVCFYYAPSPTCCPTGASCAVCAFTPEQVHKRRNQCSLRLLGLKSIKRIRNLTMVLKCGSGYLKKINKSFLFSRTTKVPSGKEQNPEVIQQHCRVPTCLEADDKTFNIFFGSLPFQTSRPASYVTSCARSARVNQNLQFRGAFNEAHMSPSQKQTWFFIHKCGPPDFRPTVPTKNHRCVCLL